MKRIIATSVTALMLVLMLGCKAKAVATASPVAAKADVEADEVIAGHYKNDKDFRTLNIKADARYEDKDDTQNVSADIRIRKDEKILVSIRFLGITMAKALITPEEVKYYEKINGQYFEGDFRALSKWLGTELDFGKVQNLLLGLAIDDLRKTPHDVRIDGKLFRVDANGDGLLKSFFFEGGKFHLKRQEISQPGSDRQLTALYPAYRDFPQAALPTGLVLEATQQKGKVKINVEYNAATFNEDLSFPYSVPSGYDRIFID